MTTSISACNASSRTDAELKTRLATNEEALTANRALLLERETALADGARKHTELSAQIDQLRNSLLSAEVSSEDAHREVTLAAKARGDEERRRIELEGELRAAATRHDALVAERDAAHAQILALTGERDALLPAKADLTTRTAELERTVAAVARLREQLAGAQTDAQASEQLAQERADEFVSMREKVDEFAVVVRRLEDDLQAQEQVVEGLRVQLQTAHEECAIMADQREKARAAPSNSRRRSSAGITRSSSCRPTSRCIRRRWLRFAAT